MSRVVFLMGAGASMDAGLPSVAQLTEELRSRLPDLRDINQDYRPKFAALFDEIARLDPSVGQNYERFFEWLGLLNRVQKDPFAAAISIKLNPALRAASGQLAFVIKRPIWEILRSRHQSSAYHPEYLGGLKHVLPSRGRLRVFSLNYDLCVEDACRSAGIRVVTGYEPDTGRWAPSEFAGNDAGINLYKLHGSLNWRLSDGLTNQSLVEDYPAQWDREPELLLGPGLKLEPDDPYARLHCEYRSELSDAETCVIIGYGFHDESITKALKEADDRGMRLIDVNPSPANNDFVHYHHLPCTAKSAFETGDLWRLVLQE